MNLRPMLRCASLVLFVCLEASAGSELFPFPPPRPPGPQPVMEYRNLVTDRYFITITAQEASMIDRGFAGRGWTPTGQGFAAVLQGYGSTCLDCKPVYRFYRPAGAAHLFTADEQEIAILSSDGSWVIEGIAFLALLPDSVGACRPGTAAVHRLHNNRFALGDGGHRYLANPQEREAMQAAGWIDEGPVFCTPAVLALEPQWASFSFDASSELVVGSGTECRQPQQPMSSCLAVENLPRPAHEWFGPGSEDYFEVVTGVSSSPHTIGPGPANERARDVFVQVKGSSVGVHLDTRMRGAGLLSSISLVRRLDVMPQPRFPHEEFHPWRPTPPFETELAIRGEVRVQTFELRSSGSHAYGHPSIEFLDERSGGRIRFTLLAYGTVPSGEFVAPDPSAQKVIVSTSLRAGSPFGRNLGGEMVPLPFMVGGPVTTFDFRMDSEAFRGVIAAARSAMPTLSQDPHDYRVDNFDFHNEIVGDGRLGVREKLSIGRVRR